LGGELLIRSSPVAIIFFSHSLSRGMGRSRREFAAI